jgi:hypothetical protein
MMNITGEIIAVKKVIKKWLLMFQLKKQYMFSDGKNTQWGEHSKCTPMSAAD